MKAFVLPCRLRDMKLAEKKVNEASRQLLKSLRKAVYRVRTR